MISSEDQTSSGRSDGVSTGSVATIGTTSDTSHSKSTTGYCLNYFDINDIMASSRRVMATTLAPMPSMGPVLDPNGEGMDLAEGTKLELPIWLARELHAQELVRITVPKGYNQTYREILEADANCVDLHKLGPDFYRFGQHLVDLGLDESEDIARCLVETFHQRYHRLANHSLSATNDTVNEVQAFGQQLDNEEKRLLNTGKQALDQTKEWENRTIEKVTADDLVVSLRKRKRILMNDINTTSCVDSQTN